MPYVHDIFLSVKSGPTFGDWVNDTFIPLFKSYLDEDIDAACDRPSEGIFYYRQNLKPGDPWPDELRSAILNSRVAVALCSPSYFRSKWCLTEFHSFWDRGRNSNTKVLVPAKIHDGKAFPGDVMHNLQFADFSEFVIVGEGFKKTEGYSRFQDALKRFSEQVAALVAQAPPHANWPFFERAAPGTQPEVRQQTLTK